MEKPVRSQAVVKRYRDAYRVANAVVGISKAIKGIGIALMVIVVLGCLLFAMKAVNQGGQDANGIAGIIGSLMAGGMVWLVFWIIGVLVGSQGQILLASLDSAVNHSPFLHDEERAEVMSLGSAAAGAGQALPATDSGGT
jgi:hypothetical protein